ncbi:hypothetical protein KMZ29_18410 [Bradyrhizobium sediminis]|uniref:Uncharacterized protein n=1 Tax=Bradyrhizobium sediminis TaxID=2840469 RepID=A0A975NBX9_9BRAD|nr:hypothetical protein [Bradyrhizobium sediminis]QWG11691.1 hypothetical protein KMZ29_18410 [Bradyrhizobium sediminis]
MASEGDTLAFRQALMKLAFETDDEKSRWPWVALAVVIAFVVAAWISFPNEIISFLKEGKELLASKEGSGKPGQESKNSMCNGFIVVNCSAEPKIVQGNPPEKTAQAPLEAENKIAPPLQYAPVVAQSQPGRSSPQPSKVRKPEAKNALAESDAPLYRYIGPKDDLTLLGIDRFKPSVNLCALKKHVTCYMPPGFGRESIVREQED